MCTFDVPLSACPETCQVGLIGPNGCGKSTQLLMLMNKVEPNGGRLLGYRALLFSLFQFHDVPQFHAVSIVANAYALVPSCSSQLR